MIIGGVRLGLPEIFVLTAGVPLLLLAIRAYRWLWRRLG